MALDGISGSGPLIPTPRRPLAHAPEPAATRPGDALTLAGRPGPTRTAADARREAEAVFHSAATTATVEARRAAIAARDRAAFDAAGYVEVGLGTHDYREVLLDPEAVNRDRFDADLRDPKKEAEARRQVAANAALEAAAREALAPAERTRFDAVARALGAEPTARLALQLLLIDGKLPGAPDRVGGSLLAGLAGLTAPGATHDALPAAALIADLVQEIHLPSAISQQEAATCTATTLQILLARSAPAEYVRLVAGLAGPAGTARLANGDMLVREPGTERALPFLTTDQGQEVETADTRSGPARLFQGAVMEYANGEAGYDPQRERHTNGRSGMAPDMLARALAGLGRPPAKIHDLTEGTEARAAEVSRLLAAARAEKDPAKAAELSVQAMAGYEAITKEVADRRQAMLDDVTAALARGEAVPIGVSGWRGVEVAPGDLRYVGAHALLATRVEGDFIHYVNPHGTEERMNKAAFLQRVGAALIP